ncbi:hypothetical protein EDB84DRAFT_1562950 [Lactarius hengduanensis]|nr:hypothetical protein EDB84DRAFT_1562950 [Lactarius hengduanensis]
MSPYSMLRVFANSLTDEDAAITSSSRYSILWAFRIHLLDPAAPTCLKLQVCREPLSRQLFSIAAVICDYFSAHPFYMEDLRITDATIKQAGLGTKWFRVAGEISTDIVLALQHSDMRRETDAIVSFVHARRLSGQFIGVEFEQPSTNGLGGTGTFSQQVTIEMLSDDVVLDIFRHHQNASPQLWPTSAKIQVAFSVPSRLPEAAKGTEAGKGIPLLAGMA